MNHHCNKPPHKQQPPPSTPQRQARYHNPNNTTTTTIFATTPACECHPPRTTLRPFPRWKGVREHGHKEREGKKSSHGACGVFPACFSAAGVKGRGGAAHSRLVDARREAVGGEERPFGRSCSKEGGAENGVERRAEPRAIKGGPHARLALFFLERSPCGS